MARRAVEPAAQSRRGPRRRSRQRRQRDGGESRRWSSPGAGVLPYTGGGGPESDLFPADVEAIYRDAGVPVLPSDTLVPDWLATCGAPVLLNPTKALSPDVASEAKEPRG